MIFFKFFLREFYYIWGVFCLVEIDRGYFFL